MVSSSATALFLYTVATLIFCWLFYIFQKTRDTDKDEEKVSFEGDQKNGKAGSGGGKSQAKRKPVRQRKDSYSKEVVSLTDFSHKWLVATLKGHTGSVCSLSMSPNNHLLASAADDRTVLIWNVKDFETRDHKQVRVNVGFDSATRTHWSPDNKAFVIARKDEKMAEVFKLGKKPDGSIGNIQSALKFAQVHSGEIVGLGIACNGRFIMTCSADNKMVIWDLKGTVLEKKVIGNGTTLAAKVSPCARYVTACGKHDDPNMILYDVNLSENGQYKPMTNAYKLNGHKKGIYSFDISNDSHKIVTLGFDGMWRLFDTSGNRVDIKRSSAIKGSVSSEDAPVVAISHDNRVVIVGIGKNLEIYSARSGAYLSKIESVHNDSIKDIIFSIDDKHFISSGDRTIRVFNNVSGFEETIADLKDHIQDKSKSRALKTRLNTELASAEKQLADLLKTQ